MTSLKKGIFLATSSNLKAINKTLKLGVLSLLPSATRLGHIDVQEFRCGNVTVCSYMSGKGGFPLVVLHGLTREGFGDARLVRFSKMMAAVGLCVYTPNLQGLCMMDPDPAEIDSISALLKGLAKEHKSQIGLIGFSFGGTYALLASSSPEVAESIRFVVAVGAYYSLEDVVERAFSLRGQRDLSPEEAYTLLALDWKYRKMLLLTEEERAGLEKLVGHCSRENHFTPEDTALVSKIMSLQQQEDIYLAWKHRLSEISSLNIEGNPVLESIKASVFLLHGENDTSIPIDASSRIAVELEHLHKNVVRHIGRSGDHMTFSIRNDAGLARFFYRMMLMTDLRNTRISGRKGRDGSIAK